MNGVASFGVLLDGALLRGHEKFDELLRHDEAIALYGDMGPDAASVGPWLVGGLRLDDLGVRDWPLPERLGASEVGALCTLAQLQAHLLSIRTVLTVDKSSFYLRFADMRALAALLAALGGSEAPRRRLLGPIVSWSYVDRKGTQAQWVTPEPGRAAHSSDALESPLVLTDAQLDRLEVASLADRLAAAVEELDDARAQPHHRADQYALVEAAAVFIKTHDIANFVAQRAIARKSLEEGAGVLHNAQFVSALPSLVQMRDSESAIISWSHHQSAMTQGKAADGP